MTHQEIVCKSRCRNHCTEAFAVYFVRFVMAARVRTVKRHRPHATDQGTQEIPPPLVGRCRFPMVDTSADNPRPPILGAILIYDGCPDCARKWILLSEDSDNGFAISARLTAGLGPDKTLAVQSSLMSVPQPKGIHFVDVETPSNVSFIGSSCGLATFIAAYFGVTNFVATGFLLEGGTSVPRSLQVMDIENLTTKLTIRGAPIICPMKSLRECLSAGVISVDQIYGVEKLVAGLPVPPILRAVPVETVGDLIALLTTLLKVYSDDKLSNI